MSAKDSNSRTQTAKPDDFIQDYLSDVWGFPVDNKKSIGSKLVQEKLSRFAVQPIERHFSLVPTLRYSLNGVRSLLAQADLLVLLFNYLYLLRRPLSPRVREMLLAYTDQIIEDIQAAFWISQLSGKGACGEV